MDDLRIERAVWSVKLEGVERHRSTPCLGRTREVRRRNDFADNTVLNGLFCTHPVVAIGIIANAFQRLTRLLSNNPVDALAGFQNLAGVYFYITRIAAKATGRLAKTDRITVIGGGADGGTGLAGITGDVARMMAQIPPIAESLTGIKISDVIGRVTGAPRAKDNAAQE